MSKVNVQEKPTSAWAFEEAHEAVIKIKTLKPLLSPKEEESLAILMDKELMNHLYESLKEARAGDIEPLENILK
jgi:hypothetical protein